MEALVKVEMAVEGRLDSQSNVESLSLQYESIDQSG